MSQPELQTQQLNYAVPAEAAGWEKKGRGGGGAAALATAAGFFIQPDQLLRGYLIGYMLWLGLSLGCMAMLMVQHLSGGLWGLSIRRILEASSKGVYLMLVLFIPLVLGRHNMYFWMNGEGVNDHNAWYLNMGFWWLRQAIYFGSWLTMMYVLNKRSALQDQPSAVGPQPGFEPP